MSAARHVKAATAGIAECVTEDHLPIRWSYGTRPAKFWHWRAIRRWNPFEQQLPTATSTTNRNFYCYCWYGTAHYLLRLQNCDFNYELLPPSVKPGTLFDHWLQ